MFLFSFLFFLLAKSVLATLERGLSWSVLGDTPTPPVVSFVLLRQLTDLLNEARSKLAFSKDFILVMHLVQTSDGKCLPFLTSTSRRIEILLGNPCSKYFSLNSLVICLEDALVLHSLQGFIDAEAIVTTKKCRSKAAHAR